MVYGLIERKEEWLENDRETEKCDQVVKAKIQYPTKIEWEDLTTKSAVLQYRTNSGKIHPGPLGPENSPDL